MESISVFGRHRSRITCTVNELHQPLGGTKAEDTDEHWKLLDRKAMSMVHLSLSRKIAQRTQNVKLMKEMLDIVSGIYEKSSTTNTVHLMRLPFNKQIGEDTNVGDHLDEFNIVT